jgi:hypothetical protein
MQAKEIIDAWRQFRNTCNRVQSAADMKRITDALIESSATTLDQIEIIDLTKGACCDATYFR